MGAEAPGPGGPGAISTGAAASGGRDVGIVAHGLVLGYVDLAITGALDYPRYSSIYLGPWWPVEDVPDGAHVWKRSVLERVPSRGARHWGHLFLVVRRTDLPRFSIFRRNWRGERIVDAPEAHRVSLRSGVQPAELVVQPSGPAWLQPLRQLAEEISERYHRQMD